MFDGDESGEKCVREFYRRLRRQVYLKEIHLKELKSVGARQFCEIRPRKLRVIKKKRIDRRWSWLDLRLLSGDGKQYAITIWKTKGRDPETLTLIESQFAT